MSLNLTSSAFQHNTVIPAKYTGDGLDESPPLRWSDPPEGTESFALVCNDPDAPAGDWVHWLLFNLPANARELKANQPTSPTLDHQVIQAKNDFGRLGYGGPAPPRGKTHHYHFRLYALDKKLELASGTTKHQLENAMKGHILDHGELIGTYSR